MIVYATRRPLPPRSRSGWNDEARGLAGRVAGIT
jgi:hypothetical protein